MCELERISGSPLLSFTVGHSLIVTQHPTPTVADTQANQLRTFDKLDAALRNLEKGYQLARRTSLCGSEAQIRQGVFGSPSLIIPVCKACS
jgi:hypothetical protein